MKFLRLVFDNIARNVLRTVLTSLGTMTLVLVVTLVLSVLTFLDRATTEQTQNLKAIVTERWQIPSILPFRYADTLSRGSPRKEGDYVVEHKDSMTWTFYGGSTEEDPKKRSRDNMLFMFAVEPRVLLDMMDELDTLKGPPRKQIEEATKRLEDERQGIILGRDRLATLARGGSLTVGDKIKLYGLNFRDINLELTIVGVFPEGRYDNSAVINREYLFNSLDAYQQKNKKPHPMADRNMNLVWLRVKDQETFQKVAKQILDSPEYSSPQVKCQTASSGISTFLDAYRDLIWGMRWVLAPAILITLSLVISNAISISVRERRIEFAVLKVLGFRPTQILILVLGEALLVGLLSGFTSALLTWGVTNYYFGGIKFPIAFFGVFYIPIDALWWGAAIGFGTALVGSVFPAWEARTVRVADVFSKVT